MTLLCNASTVSTFFCTQIYTHTLAQMHTEHQPTPSTSPTMPFPTASPPEGTTSSPPPPPPPGDTTSTPPPPPGGMPSTPSLDVEYIITICVPAVVIVIIAVLGFAGCVTVCCVWRRHGKQRSQAEILETKADKLDKEVDKLVYIKHLSNNIAKKRLQEGCINDKRRQIDRLRNQAMDLKTNAKELRDRANEIQNEVTQLHSSDLTRQKREQIRAKEKEIKSLHKQANILSDAGEDDVDSGVEKLRLDGGEDDESVVDATCRSTTNPHANGRTDYETVDGSIHIEIPEEVLFKESCL